MTDAKADIWTIEYDNDTGPDDDGFWEWWTVTDGNRSFKCDSESDANWLLAALAAQPAEPVAMLYDDGTWIAEKTATGRALSNRMLFAGSPKIGVYAAPPAPAAVPPIDDMDKVAIRYAHKMALDLECILAEYGGSWYNTAMQTLGEYRSAMNAIHERESPTFMGEPVTAAGDKT